MIREDPAGAVVVRAWPGHRVIYFTYLVSKQASLLAGPYYFDVDMVNSLPNVARQLGRRGMVREASLQALSKLCSERDPMGRSC